MKFKINLYFSKVYSPPPERLMSWPIISRGVAATPPNVYIPEVIRLLKMTLTIKNMNIFLIWIYDISPIIVVRADLITPTQAVVRAEFTVVQRKIE